MGSPALYRSFLCEMSNFTSSHIIAPEYRLAPEAKFPCQIIDFIDSLEACNDIYQPQHLFIAGIIDCLAASQL